MPDLNAKTEITVDQIIQDFGDYYLDHGQNENNLHMLPMEEFETQSAFMTVPTNETVIRESTVEMSEILQPYQDEFTPKGDVEFKPVTTLLHKVKIDQEFNPHKLQSTWLAFLASNKTDVSTWPFIRWFIQVYLMKKSKEDMEMHSIYSGVQKAPETGVAGDAVDTMDGIETIMNKHILNGSLVPITVGAIEALDEDFVTQVEEFVQGIPEKYRYMPLELNMNRSLRDKFKRGTRAKYKMTYAPGDIKNFQVADAENVTVVGRPSMQGKDRIWCSPSYNLPFYVKGFENVNGFQVEKAKRKVAIYTEWWVGLNMIQPEIFFTSDGESPL